MLLCSIEYLILKFLSNIKANDHKIGSSHGPDITNNYTLIIMKNINYGQRIFHYIFWLAKYLNVTVKLFN